MIFHKEYLDLVFVPSGLLLMFGYHLFLLYRCLHLPHKTVFGFENNDKKAWVERVMQVERKDNALSALASNTSAATFFASVSLTLSALIGAWMANNSNVFTSELIFGDTRQSTMSVKYITLLICFILAFSFFVQSARAFIHANYLVSLPLGTDIPIKYVQMAVLRGGNFWSLGLRAIYFAINLLLWFFGPIPMFAASLAMVGLLHHLDTNTAPLHKHGVPGKVVADF